VATSSAARTSAASTSQGKQKILIVGGGFGGVKTALELSKHDAFDITITSSSPNFTYFPTFYHTATGGLEAESQIPLAELFANKPVDFVLGSAKKLDRSKQQIITEDGKKFHYDTLILGLGSITNYFGIEGLKEYSYGIKSMAEISRFKQHLHDQLTDPRNPEMNYVVVGGGPTGVELAGALPDYLRIIRKNHGLPQRRVHIDLVEASPRLLIRCAKSTSKAVHQRLRKLGVKIYTKTAVQGETADSLIINGKPLQSHTVIWTSGVANNPFFKDNGFTLTERGKVHVDEYLCAEPQIFVIGDNNDTQYSGMAQTALYDAEFLSENLVRLVKNEKLKPYKAKMPVTVVPVGSSWAAVEWGKLRFAGRSGWLMRAAADWIGFHDVEPVWQATEQWFTSFGSQEKCDTCKAANLRVQ
jgi:NADH dehydrogenase